MSAHRWVEPVVTGRGWTIAEGPGGGELIVHGSSSGITWTCVLDGDETSSDEPRRRTVVWRWADAMAAPEPGERLLVHEPGSVPWWRVPTTGDDAAVLALAAGRGLFQRLNRRHDRAPTIDVRAALEIVDPLGIVSGEVERRLLHWPSIPASPGPSAFSRLDELAGDAVRPADAPPASLVVRHGPPGEPLTVSAAWWQRPDWLEHQVGLGVAVAAALVRRRG
jgi:hypothetical protein